MKSRLIRFNPRRASRGNVGAAEVEFDDGENVTRLWLNERDIAKNLALFVDYPPEATQGVRDAQAAYKRPWKEITEPAS